MTMGESDKRSWNLTSSNVDECLDFFSHRLSHLPQEMEFNSFFRYQFSRYMSMKPNTIIGLIEGDMVSDLILSTFEEALADMTSSLIPLSREGWVNLLLHMRITFPCHYDAKEDDLF